jgi:hypothetical protein
VTDASASTIWRSLHDDALKPWQQRSWILVRDPAFRERAGRVLDLNQRRFEGRRLRPDDLVICADEKSQLQALGRRHETVAARPGRPALFEFEHRRRGTLAYLAAWDSPIGCCASASTTARSPDRSTGPSPAPTWSACSPRSPSASRGLRLRRNGPRSRGRLAAQGCCQRALMIFHPSPVRTRWRYST